ncbi:hypothetical protein FACS189473_3310 [Spirochaetia bacterium]|nr:hypothetical protein FACS189473_3310 [Spirochaetia bacterium]
MNTKILFIPVVIPLGDIWLPSVNADFGQFTNGKSGFKASVNLPVLGEMGVFVAPGSFVIGGVSSYKIEKPAWAAPSLRSSVRRSTANPGIVSSDASDRTNVDDVTYTVTVQDEGLERVVFLLAYIEGDPVLTAVSPSGVEYHAGDEKTEVVFMENVLALIVHEPEDGLWKVRVSDIEEDAYELTVLGSAGIPALTITEPSFGTEMITEGFTVRGETERGYSHIVVKAREEQEKPGFELGNFPVNRDGSFEVFVPVDDIADGEYFISVELATDDTMVSPVVYAPGKIRLDRSGLPLTEPEPVRGAETDPGTVNLHWMNNNGRRTEGYNIRILNMETGHEDILFAGNITSLSWSGFRDGDRLSFQAAALDANRRESAWSNPVTITIGGEKPVINRPSAVTELIRVTGVPGGFIEGTAAVTINEYQDSYESSGYILARRQGGAAEGVHLYFEGPVNVGQSSGDSKTIEIPWYMGIPDSMSPGTYYYNCEAVNEANGSLSAPFTIEVTVRWSQPEITAVEPSEIDGREEHILGIYGSGFMPGTKVLFRGNELAVTAAGNSWMEAVLPKQEKAGEAALTVIGPDGSTSAWPITVMLPDWYAEIYTRTVETVPGGTADYRIGIKGINGFTGAASFGVTEKQEGIDVTLPVIPVNHDGVIRITVDRNTAFGTYITVISGGEGKEFELVTVVGKEPPAPHLSALSPASGFTGTEVHVYGYGLGENTGGRPVSNRLYFNQNPVETSSWTDSEIVFTVPDDAVSGTIRVTGNAGSGNSESNALSFAVKNRGFSLRPDTAEVELTAGEKRSIELALTGYADTVKLMVENESGAPMTAVLAQDTAAPNAIIRLDISVAENCGMNGTWKIRVQGTSRNYEADTEITVTVVDVPEIETRTLPDGLAEVSYYTKLVSRNTTGVSGYRLVKGELPPGLELTRQGEIRGRPRYTGRYQAEIEVKDSAGRGDARTFSITVREEVWGQTGKDGGHSRAVHTELPAGNEPLFRVKVSGQTEYLLAAEEKIIVVSDESITVIRAADGRTLWTTPGTYREAVYAGGKLYALTEGDVLETRDLDNGSLLWSRDGIRAFSSDGTVVLAETGAVQLVIDAAQGILREQKDQIYNGTNTVIWMNNTAYKIDGNLIVPVYGPGTSLETDSRILAAAADAQGMILAAENGLVILDRSFRIEARLEKRYATPVELALTGETVMVSEYGLVSGYRRENLELIHTWLDASARSEGSADYTAGIAAGNDMAFILSHDGFALWNRFSGECIWKETKPYRTFALYRERIYAADTEGYVTAFGGPSNLSGPEVGIKVNPPEPDGANGWYVTAPVVHITSTDRETYAAETRAWIDESEIKISAELPDQKTAILLDDGEHQIVTYAVDSRGLRSPQARLAVRVDTELPRSELTLSEEEPESEWYTAPVSISLEAWDDVSGLDRIWTSMGAYTEPVICTRQGISKFSWWAIDRAGNQERVRHHEIRIDFEPPYVEAEVFSGRGAGELRITASDRASGVEAIEYRINGGPVEVYLTPLVFEEGRYQIQYRARDKAGNCGQWQNTELLVNPAWAEASLIEAASINGMVRSVVPHARNGMPLVRTAGTLALDKSNPAALINLPSYSLGGEYILWEPEDALSDETSVIRFRVTKDAAVYLFIPDNSDLRPGDAPQTWSFVEISAGINRVWYHGGTNIYMKRFTAGSRVEIPGTRNGMMPPFIAVQETGMLFADIKIRPDETEPDRSTARTSFGEYEAGTAIILDCDAGPWQYSRRLPLRKQWLVNTETGWIPLEENRYTLPEFTAENNGGEYLRFRLELYTPDGQTEYRAEKTIRVIEKHPEEG